MREAPKRILIVEDTAGWQDIIARMLKQHFNEGVCTAVQTWDEIALYRRGGEPDLITMDGSLSDLGGEGPKFVRLLRAEAVTCPIIMISGDDHSILHGIREGANEGCSKDEVTNGGLLTALQKLEFVA